MKYLVTQKMLAMGGDYSVADEKGNEVYYFDGKVFRIGGKKVAVLDSHKKEIARIKRKLFTFRPTYILRRNGLTAATVRKRGFSRRVRFVIDVPGSNDYEIIGDFIGKEYTIKRGSTDVARVSKKFFGATDSYGVEVKSGDTMILLTAVIVVDMVLYTGLKTN